jgi:hypothetical protein
MEHREKLILERIINHWKIPSGEGVIHLEGKPTEERRLENIQRTTEKRLNWKPGSDAMDIYRQLLSMEGHWVVIELWDDIIVMMEEEGPLPFKCLLKGVAIKTVQEQDRDFDQLFIEITDAEDIQNGNRGGSALPLIQYVAGAKANTLNCSLIYSVSEW